MEENLRIIISGGGTGGHIFPAVSIANAIKEQHPEAEILFVGAEGRMEMLGLWLGSQQSSALVPQPHPHQDPLTHTFPLNLSPSGKFLLESLPSPEFSDLFFISQVLS